MAMRTYRPPRVRHKRMSDNYKTGTHKNRLLDAVSFCVISVCLLSVLATGCSSGSGKEYAVLDSAGRDTGNRVKLVKKSNNKIAGRLIAENDYKKGSADYFEVPFTGIIVSDSMGGGKISVKGQPATIHLQYGVF